VHNPKSLQPPKGSTQRTIRIRGSSLFNQSLVVTFRQIGIFDGKSKAFSEYCFRRGFTLIGAIKSKLAPSHSNCDQSNKWRQTRRDPDP
jgi:hypothetical protein